MVTSFPLSRVMVVAPLVSASCSVSLSLNMSVVSRSVSELTLTLAADMLSSVFALVLSLVSPGASAAFSSSGVTESSLTISVTELPALSSPHPPRTRAVLKNNMAINLFLLFMISVSLSFTMLFLVNLFLL